MIYKFYFYNKLDKQGNIDLLNMTVEEINMETDSDALIYAKDYVTDINKSSSEAETDEDIINFLDDIDTDSSDCFCIAIVKDNDTFIYGDNYTLDYISDPDSEDDDSITEAIQAEEKE